MKAENITRRILQAGVLALAINFISVASASAKTAPAFPNIAIKNFGQMDERFFRGAQPGEGDYKSLASLGIKTIIDLRDDPTSYEKREAQGCQTATPMIDTAHLADCPWCRPRSH